MRSDDETERETYPDERDGRFDFHGDPPPFFVCGQALPSGEPCKVASTIVPCHDCKARLEHANVVEEERERFEAAMMRRIPPESRWARLDHPDLAARVSLKSVRSQSIDGSARFDVVSPAMMAERILAHPAWVLFAGPARSGKTSLAVACLQARGRGFFVSACELAVARAHHSLGEGEAPLVARALRARLLLLDDLGEENCAQSPIAHVLKERWRANRATWITTGLTRDEIAARYGEGIVGRLFEPPRAMVVTFASRSK